MATLAFCLLVLSLAYFLGKSFAGAPINAEVDVQINILRQRLHMDDSGVLDAKQRRVKAELWKNLGLLLLGKDVRSHHGGGALQPEALDAFDKALTLDKEDATDELTISANYFKGILLKLMGLGNESVLSLNIALDVTERHYSESSNSGSSTSIVGDVDQASLYYSRAESLFMLGDVSSAVADYRKSLNFHNCRTERYYSLVNALKESKMLSKSDWDELLQQIKQVIQLCSSGSHPSQQQPKQSVHEDDAQRQQQLFRSSADDYEDEGEEGNQSPSSTSSYSSRRSLLEMGGAGDTANFPYAENSDAYWALHGAAEQAQRYSQAWWYLETGNSFEKSKRELKFSASEAIAQTQGIISIFQKQFWQQLPSVAATSSTVPIFIIGMMRSGSTLLETMLDSHSNIWGMGEDSIFNANLGPFRDKLVKLSSKASAQQPQSQAAVDALTEVRAAIKKHILKFGIKTAKTMKKLAIGRLTRNGTESGGGQGGGGGGPSKHDIKYVVDKMLFNYRNIGFIHMVYPNAVILHTVRDPIDTIFSCYKNKFDDWGLEWTLDHSDLILQYVLYLEVMHHFRLVLPGRVIDVRYEDLVTRTETTLRHIVEQRLNLTWESDMLRSHTTKRAVNTHSMTQVRHEVTSHAVGSWTKYREALRPILTELRASLAPLLKAGKLPFATDSCSSSTSSGEDGLRCLKMNWEVNELYDYNALRRQGIPTSTSPSVSASTIDAADASDSKTRISSIAVDVGETSVSTDDISLLPAAPPQAREEL